MLVCYHKLLQQRLTNIGDNACQYLRLCLVLCLAFTLTLTENINIIIPIIKLNKVIEVFFLFFLDHLPGDLNRVSKLGKSDYKSMTYSFYMFIFYYTYLSAL